MKQNGNVTDVVMFGMGDPEDGNMIRRKDVLNVGVGD